jgi:hypothetical protein
VRHPPHQRAGRAGRRGTAADHPAGHGDDRHPGCQASQRGRRGAADDEAGQRAAGPHGGLQGEQCRQRAEALPALQDTGEGADHREGQQRRG